MRDSKKNERRGFDKKKKKKSGESRFKSSVPSASEITCSTCLGPNQNKTSHMFSSQKDDSQKKPPITITTRKKIPNVKNTKITKKRGQPRLSEVPYRKHGADNQRLPCYLGFYKKIDLFYFYNIRVIQSWSIHKGKRGPESLVTHGSLLLLKQLSAGVIVVVVISPMAA